MNNNMMRWGKKLTGREVDEGKMRYERVHAYDIPHLFSSSNRDFLLRSNGDKVQSESLRGKIIGIHLWRVSDVTRNPNLKLAVDLLDAYEEHYPKGDFEVVSVAIVDEEEEENVIKAVEQLYFNRKFYRMPWLAIPYSDIETRRKLTKEFGTGYSERCESVSFLSANGKLLTKDGDKYLYELGGEYYPFTNEKVKEVVLDKETSFCQLEISSIHSLLATPNRNFLISNQGNKVQISNLEGQVVGLYLYGSKSSLSLLPKLEYIYNEIKVKRGSKFEIVFVNLHFTTHGCVDEESFNETFNNMPWLALPFKDKMCRTLWRKYNHARGDDGVFVVVSFNGKSVEPYGAKIIKEYGTDAYPFTREKASMLERRRLKDIKMFPRVMAYNGSLIRNRRDDTKVHVAKIFGKNILLFVGAVNVSSTLKLVPELLKWYREIKSKDENFEIIYLSRDQDIATFQSVFQKMPWLTFPCKSDQKLCAMFDGVLDDLSNDSCYLVAVGKDGRVASTDAATHLRRRGIGAFPFKDADLLEDVKVQLAKRLVWEVTDKVGRSYSPNFDDPNLCPRYTNRFVEWVESRCVFLKKFK